MGPNTHILNERAHALVKAAFHSPRNKGKIIINLQAQACTLGPASLEPMIWQGSGSEHVSQLLQALQRFPVAPRIKSTLLQQPTRLCRSDPSGPEAPPGPLVHTPRTPHHCTLSGFAHAVPSTGNTLPLVPPTPVHLFFRLHQHVPLSKCPSVTSTFSGSSFSCIFLPGYPQFVERQQSRLPSGAIYQQLRLLQPHPRKGGKQGCFLKQDQRPVLRGLVKNENASPAVQNEFQVSNSRALTQPLMLLSMGCMRPHQSHIQETAKCSPKGLVRPLTCVWQNWPSLQRQSRALISWRDQNFILEWRHFPSPGCLLPGPSAIPAKSIH